MFNFDDRLSLLNLKLDYDIGEEDYERLKSFIASYFSEFGEVVINPISGYYNRSINFNVGDEYCCFTIDHDCLLIRRVYIPLDKRGKGYFSGFISPLELLLPQLGIKSVCFENVQNNRLCKFLLSKGYSKAYFNYPIPSNEDELDLPEVYKLLA